jgi:hypothetical protein
MSTNLSWIGERARKQPDLVFSSLYHHVSDVDNLSRLGSDFLGLVYWTLAPCLWEVNY